MAGELMTETPAVTTFSREELVNFRRHLIALLRLVDLLLGSKT
jgi:hypothetical protein